MAGFLCAIDLGTTQCKVAIYDVKRKRCGFKATVYDVITNARCEEQNPDVWFEAAVKTLKGLLQEIPEAAEDMLAICISGTNAWIFVDKDRNPVYHAILFNDRRSEEQAIELLRVYGQELIKITGNRPWPGATCLPVMNWFLKEHPELWNKVDKFLVPAGYLLMKLTGKLSIDTSRASLSLLFDIAGRKWSETILAAEKIPFDLCPDLYEPWQLVGGITPNMANLLGLKSGTPVLAGCVDSVAACLGTGVINSDKTLIIMGTTGRVIKAAGKPSPQNNLVNQCHAVPERWIGTGVLNNACSSLNWLIKNCYSGPTDYHEVEKAAHESAPGANGLLFLPYFNGERGPVWDLNTKGAFLGLGTTSNRGDMVRAVLEGVAFSFRKILEIIEEDNESVSTELILAGGGANSPLWRSILCDVIGRSVALPQFYDTEVLGGILLSGCAAGVWRSINEAVLAVNPIEGHLEPNQDVQLIYQQQFEAFKEVYSTLKPVFNKNYYFHQ